MNVLNEEIMALKQLTSHLEKAIPLELDTNKKQKLKNDLKLARELLMEKLEKCEDYKG